MLVYLIPIFVNCRLSAHSKEDGLINCKRTRWKILCTTSRNTFYFNLLLSVIGTYVRGEWMALSGSINNTSVYQEVRVCGEYFRNPRIFKYNLVQYCFRFPSGLDATEIGTATIWYRIFLLSPVIRQTHYKEVRIQVNYTWRSTSVVIYPNKISYFNP